MFLMVCHLGWKGGNVECGLEGYRKYCSRVLQAGKLTRSPARTSVLVSTVGPRDRRGYKLGSDMVSKVETEGTRLNSDHTVEKKTRRGE